MNKLSIHMNPVTDASAWTGHAVDHDRSWEFTLTERQQAELVDALQRVNAHELKLADITRAEFPLTSSASMLHQVLHELRVGRGFAVLHGVPTEEMSLKELEKLYWGLCTHLGTGVTQNSEAGLIHYVTDGKRRPQQGTRGVGNPGPVGLHVDLTDCVALFCVQQAPDDPHSLIASSMTVYNEILKQHPEWLPRLYEGFVWDRAGEEGPDESPASDYKVPAFSEAQGKVSCRLNSSWIRKGMARIGESLSEEELAIFGFIGETAAANSYPVPLHTGDILICNNYTVFHGRAGHEPIEDEGRKRLLFRIWMDLPDVRPFADEARIRYGVIRHGNLGWTAADLLAGNHRTPHKRREDGAPALS